MFTALLFDGKCQASWRQTNCQQRRQHYKRKPNVTKVETFDRFHICWWDSRCSKWMSFVFVFISSLNNYFNWISGSHWTHILISLPLFTERSVHINCCQVILLDCGQKQNIHYQFAQSLQDLLRPELKLRNWPAHTRVSHFQSKWKVKVSNSLNCRHENQLIWLHWPLASNHRKSNDAKQFTTFSRRRRSEIGTRHSVNANETKMCLSIFSRYLLIALVLLAHSHDVYSQSQPNAINEICNTYNGRRIYLELGEHGVLQASNVDVSGNTNVNIVLSCSCESIKSGGMWPVHSINQYPEPSAEERQTQFRSKIVWNVTVNKESGLCHLICANYNLWRL